MALDVLIVESPPPDYAHKTIVACFQEAQGAKLIDDLLQWERVPDGDAALDRLRSRAYQAIVSAQTLPGNYTGLKFYAVAQHDKLLGDARKFLVVSTAELDKNPLIQQASAHLGVKVMLAAGDRHASIPFMIRYEQDKHC